MDVLNLGSYNVTYYASSLSGLSSTKVINVEVIDPTTIEISGNNPFTLERYMIILNRELVHLIEVQYLFITFYLRQI